MSTITSMKNIIAERDRTLDRDDEVCIEEEPQFSEPELPTLQVSCN